MHFMYSCVFLTMKLKSVQANCTYTEKTVMLRISLDFKNCIKKYFTSFTYPLSYYPMSLVCFLRRTKWQPTPVLLPGKIPWTGESGRLQSMGSRRVGRDWATSFWLFTFMHWRRKWQPTPVCLPGESQGQGSLVGCLSIYGVAQSRTWLKRLSSSSLFLKLMYSVTENLYLNYLLCWSSTHCFSC